MSEQREDLGPPPVPLSGALWFFGALAVLALGITIFLGMRQPEMPPMPSGADDPLVGKSLGSFHLEPLSGDGLAIDPAALQGKVTLINFWGTWCPPCQDELPHIYRLYKKLKAREDFQFVSVSCEQSEEKDIERLKDVTERYLERAKYDFNTHYDPQAVTRVAFMNVQRQPQFPFPTTLLFDRQGKLAGVWLGYYHGMEEDVAAVTQATLDGESPKDAKK